MSTVEAALAWAAKGFRVFPLQPGSKEPVAGVSWKRAATSDPATIRQVWGEGDYNVGCDTAGWLAVDVDVKEGKQGFASLIELDLPLETLMTRTPSGGAHYFYKVDQPVRNSASKLGDGVDVRGAGGYVVAPGSWLNPELPENKGVGGFYQLEQDVAVVDAPAHLVARCGAPRQRVDAASPAADLDSPASILRVVDYLESEAPLAVEGDGGDHTTFRVAAAVKDYGLSQEYALQLLLTRWNDRCSPPWSPEELRQKVENAYAYGFNAPGASSPQAYTAGIDVTPPTKNVNAEVTNWFRHGDEWEGGVDWLYHETFPAKGVCLLVAPSQAGKTFLLLHAAWTLATGSELFGVAPEARGGSAFLLGEGRGGFRKRLAALPGDEDLAISAMGTPVLAVDGALQALEEELRQESARMEREHEMPLRLVVLDTLSSSGLLVDENDNADVALKLKALDQMAARLNVLLVVTHHPTKTGKTERGAGALRANVDTVVEIDAESSVRRVDITKAREAEQRTLGHFTLEPVFLGTDAKGRPVKTCRVTEAEAGQSRRRVEPPLYEQFLETLEWAFNDAGVVEGQPAVEQERLFDMFADRKGGDRTGAGIRRSFRACVSFAEAAGTVKPLAWHGREYLTSLAAQLRGMAA